MKSQVEEIKEQIQIYRNNRTFICELKITELCNMRCRYCYRDEKREVEVSLQRVIDFFDELAEIHSGKIVCSFHGGEPLLRIDIIKSILHVLKKRGYYSRMAFTIQTNGILLDDAIVELFKENKVGIGVSLDFIEDFQGEDRVLVSGEKTSYVVRQKIERARALNVPVSVTCVVTRKNIDTLSDYIRWCYSNEIAMVGLNYLRMSNTDDARLQLVPDVSDYIKSTKEVIDTLIELNRDREDNYKLYVLELSNIVNKIVNSYFDCYVCNSPCQAGKYIVCLNTDGRLDCCDCVGIDKSNTIGYFERGKLNELLQIARKKEFAIDKRDIEECRNCEVGKFCTYACAAENMIFYGDRNIQKPGKLCLWYKEIIKYLLSKFENGVNPDLFVDSYL